MKALAVFLTCAIFVASAGYPDLCDYRVEQLPALAECIEKKASLRLKIALLKTRTELNCLNGACMIRALCIMVDPEDILSKYLSVSDAWQTDTFNEICTITALVIKLFY
ncbi:antimicrobial peptide microplusin-like isoform X1 [Dermacentor albipictus]|uniref:antimicrobial peptide microplusin-like isoform X1 n=1 Tax=Dermacentor albipictus TaxID=60249 RepID=UPI0031FC7CB6